MRCVFASLAGLVALFAVAAEPSAPADDAPTLKVVKYPELIRDVRDLQGKVVVVDFWADYCINCKREFPHLVALRKKYGGDGFAALSVAVDPANDKDAVGRDLQFLRKSHADFTNLLLDEPPAVWSAKLGADAVPFICVFDRDGRLAGKFDGDKANYEKYVEPLVADLLKK